MANHHSASLCRALAVSTLAALLAAGCGGAGARSPVDAGLNEFRDGDLNRAAKFFLRAARKDPSDVSAQANLGITYWRLGLPDQAVTSLRRAANLCGTNTAPLEFLVHIHLEAGQTDAAFDVAQAVLDLQQTPATFALAAVAAYHAGAVERAEAYLARALEAQPDYPPALYNTGYIMRQSGQPEAMGVLQRYLAVAGQDRHHENARRLLRGAGLGASNRAVTNQQTHVDPPPPPPPVSNAVAARDAFDQAIRRHRQGKLTQATLLYEKAMRLDPDLVEVAYNLGLACKALKEPAKARDAFVIAVESEPGNIKARYMLAVTLRELKEFAAARAQLEKVLAADPHFAQAHFLMGLVAIDENDVPTARQHLGTYIRLSPRGGSADQARAWLSRHPEEP